MHKYRTKEGDVLDAICAKYYGNEHGTTEAVLQANPNLCKLPVLLPAGLVITLPELQHTETTQTVNLWD